MIEPKRSPLEVRRQGIVAALREAAALLAAGDRGVRTRACIEHAATLAAELKALSQRMGSPEGCDEAIRMLAAIEALQGKLESSASPEQ
jgi:hypothetical protein